jgi:hypothetical protein
MNHRKKTKKGIRSLDFFNGGGKAEAENHEKADETKIAIIQKPANSEPVPEAIPSLKTLFLEFENRFDNKLTAINQKMDQKLSEIQNKTVSGDRKSLAKKKKNNQVRHICNEEWNALQKFKERPDEPFKETLKRVLRFAEKHLEPTGGTKPH